MITEQKGTFGITFTPPNRNWSTDNQTYRLGDYLKEWLSLTATKHADCTLELNISGPLSKTFRLRGPQPPCRELKLGFTWENDEMQLFMNGRLLKTFIPSQMRKK